MTTHYGTTHRSLPESAPVRMQYPTVEPLPAAGSADPRRRRTFVCGNLTINGQYWTPDVARLHMTETLRGDKADIRCEMRPGVTLKADYSQDVCLSSWGRSCPFAVGNRERAA